VDDRALIASRVELNLRKQNWCFWYFSTWNKILAQNLKNATFVQKMTQSKLASKKV
jgi:hypothetical protein